MGSYVSTAKFFQLPFRSDLHKDAFALTASDKTIIDALANSELSHIQTTKTPSSNELYILDEIFRINPNIAFRDYSWSSKSVDISYLSQLTHLKSLHLDIWSEIENIDVLEKMNLDFLALSCFHVKDYGFLKNVSPSIKGLTVELEDKTYKMDIKDILHMTDLESLGIRNVKKGLDKLSEFENLKKLYLRSVDIKDYSFLREMQVRKIYLSLQNIAYFDTFGTNESIEEVSLWMNKKLTDLSFLLQFPNLKKIIISNQKKVEIIPDLTGLEKLEEIYFLEKDAEEIRKYCNPNVKVHSYYNPVDIG
ncbi:MAG: hypothetical protein E7641_01160 [Ruminococcaceae bacterium]|nr:hypothetical protein [Oscillospiraceae bacterium]